MKWGDLNPGDQYIEDPTGAVYPRRTFVVTAKRNGQVHLHCAELGADHLTTLPIDEFIMYTRSEIVRFDNTIAEDPFP